MFGFNRNCVDKYNKADNLTFGSMEDIQDFLKFGLNPPCFKIIKHSELKKNLDKEGKYNTKKHFLDSCIQKDTIHKNQEKIVEDAKDLLSQGNEDDYEHYTLIKSVSKGSPTALSHIIFEIDRPVCTIHYICKCSDSTFSSSCISKRMSSLLIYYVAFIAKERGCSTLKLLSDGLGGTNLIKYYESLGFKSSITGKLEAWGSRRIEDIYSNDTPMSLRLQGDLIFELKPIPKKQTSLIQTNVENSSIPAIRGGSIKKKEVLYNSKKYKVCKDGRMNYIMVGINKNKIYLKNIPGKYKKLS